MLKVLIMGPAGSGKGTMSDLIVKQFPIAHISTGDMFRDEIKNKTALGLKASEYISQGSLVPDELTIEMVKSRLSKDDCANGYLLDGFPRSLPQAKAIESLGINAVINLMVDEKILVERIVNRRICRQCGEIYHLISKKPQVSGVCDLCGGELYHRSDDTQEKLEVRLKSYKNETAPVVDYYRQKGVVLDVCSDDKDQCFATISMFLNDILKERS